LERISVALFRDRYETRARSRGELRDAVDVNSLADFFETTLAGIRVAAKGGKSRQALRNIAVIAGRVYGKVD
jgi:hypothetical protein